MSELKTSSKTARALLGEAKASQVAKAVRGMDGRAGRLALSQELRGMDVAALSKALSGGGSTACALCDGPAGLEQAQAERKEQATAEGAGPERADGARTRREDGEQRAETSGNPNFDQIIDQMVEEMNREDQENQNRQENESETPEPGGGGGEGGAQATARAAGRAQTADASADPYAIEVRGVMVGDGEDIPGSFRAASGFGAAMARSDGHALDTCAHGHAGTNSWAKPGGFPGTLGLTTVTNAFVGPKFDINLAERQKVSSSPSIGGFIEWATGTGPTEWVATVNATSSTDATHPCVSSPAGEHKTGTKMVNVKGTPTAYDTYLKITPAYAGKIWAAEDEHLSDALLAYNLSLKKAADEVNKLVGPMWVADTKADAKAGPEGRLRAAMPAKLGIDPAVWRTAVWQLCLMTISGRDNLGYHTFYTSEQAPDHAGKKVVSTLTDGTTQIGTHTSASVVKLSSLP